MSPLRTFGYWLLALALVANAGLPSVGSAADHAAQAAMDLAQDAAAPHSTMADTGKAPCHEQATAAADAPSPDAPMDCCDGGACACSCMHHAPVLLLTEAPWAASPYRWLAQLGRLASIPAAPSAPAIRPPIA